MEMDRNPDPDFDFLQNGSSKRHRLLRPACLSKIFIGVLALVLFILLIVALSSGKKKTVIDISNCLYPLGGRAPFGGHMEPEKRMTSKRCEKVFDEYIKDENSQYWTDTEVTIRNARKYLLEGEDDSPTKYSAMVVFDIDETVLSNLEEISAAGYGRRNDETWKKWVTEARAPAIPASLKFFKDLRKNGFSISFLTGRHERDRKSTEKNLEASGYGTKCTDEPPPLGELCYHKLILRKKDDHRDAIIYKSEERGDLSKNFTIVASVGDQWSDLLGENRPIGVFKMPNPFYYIP
ncbi:hypothetical protein BSKO_05255 [Bryopsis sp. KO-2023]|nr:hypothetical protein BSKO_05255 [Bryopsis sp. KO-2023]